MLFIVYVDSSGRPYNDPEDYVVASVTTNEEDWQYIDNLVKQIKLKHFPHLPDEDVELHAKEMMNHSGLFKGMPWDQIYAILDDVFDLLLSTSRLLVINAVVIKRARLKKPIDLEEWAYRLLFERLNRFLERKNLLLLESGHPRQYGIMIMDSEGITKDQALRKKLVPILRRGTMFSPQLTYLIEDPLFTDSKWRNLSQLVDNIAYCIRKNHRINDPSHVSTQKWETYYAKLIPHFDAPRGSYYGYGLKIFP